MEVFVIAHVIAHVIADVIANVIAQVLGVSKILRSSLQVTLC